MPFFIISLLVQVALVVHVVKTGRNTMWIWIIVMLPLAGALAYFIVEVAPSLSGSRTGRRAAVSLDKTINPNKGLNQAVRDVSISDTVENRLALAEELFHKEEYAKVRELLVNCLKGVHQDDPDIMFRLAQTELALGNPETSKALLDELIAKNPSYKNADAHLVYARSLSALKQYDKAIEEFDVLHSYFSGPEATFYYAELCRELGKDELAQSLFEQIIEAAEQGNKHYNTLYKKWIKSAKASIKR